MISQLQRHGIKARQWWDKGCHRQPAYASFPHGALTHTERMGASLVSLPFYLDIPGHHIAYIADHLAAILEG